MPRSWSKVSVLSVFARAMSCGALIFLVAPLEAAGQNPEPETAQTNNERPHLYFITISRTSREVEHKVNPVYPPVARMVRMEGTVSLDVAVEADGSVSSVMADSGPALLAKSACDAVRQWKFSASPQASDHESVTVQFRLGSPRPDVDDRKYFPDEFYGATPQSPHYPEEAKSLGIEGQVALEITRGDNGEISDYRVLKSDNELLNSAAVDLVRNPIRVLGRQPRLGPGIHRVVVDFELNNQSLRADGPLSIAGNVLQAPAELLVTNWGLAMYPADSQENDVEGDVQVRLSLDQSGEISDVGIVSGPAPLRAAALEASKKWRFAPPSAAPAEVTLNYHFWVPK